MNINSILLKKPKNIRDYIEFYFYNLLGLSRKKGISYEFCENSTIAIMKDETSRLTEGSGKLRDRPWSNFLFYFITKEQYELAFGTNSKKRNIEGLINYEGDFKVSDWDEKYTGKSPHSTHLKKANNDKIANYIFNSVKVASPSLFIRSYVYITIVIIDQYNQISDRQYLPYYFNTNYKFGAIPRKRNFIANVKNSYLVKNVKEELEMLKDNNRDVLECVRAYQGTLEFIPETENHLNSIIKDINSEEEYILIEGPARSGKTIIAMSLLSKYPEANLLVMNHFFYNALKDAFGLLKHPFPDNRIYHQYHGKSGYYDSENGMDFSFSIVDECQRLGERYRLDERFINVDYHKHTILLGDDYQKLNPESDDGIHYINTKLNDSGKQIKKYQFESSIGVPSEIINSVKYLLGILDIVDTKPIGEYTIRLYEDKDAFIENYKSNTTHRKHLTTIQGQKRDYSDFAGFKAYPKKLQNNNYLYFLNSETVEKYYFSPYEMISRELDSIYIFLPENISPDTIRGYVLTQLYVLMTRATLSLNIFIENKETYKVFKERLNEINMSWHYSEWLRRLACDFMFKWNLVLKLDSNYLFSYKLFNLLFDEVIITP